MFVDRDQSGVSQEFTDPEAYRPTEQDLRISKLR